MEKAKEASAPTLALFENTKALIGALQEQFNAQVAKVLSNEAADRAIDLTKYQVDLGTMRWVAVPDKTG